MSATIRLGAAAFCGVLSIAGLGLVWNNINGLSSTALAARENTAESFFNVYMLLFTFMSIIGQMKDNIPLTTLGLFGVATTMPNLMIGTFGVGIANINSFKHAVGNENVNYIDTRFGDADANKQMLAGTLILTISAILQFFIAIPFQRDRKSRSPVVLALTFASLAIVTAMSIATWTSDLSDLVEVNNTNTLLQFLVYASGLNVTVSAVVVATIAATGIAFDVSEYVFVGIIFTCNGLSQTLISGFKLVDFAFVISNDDIATGRALGPVVYVAVVIGLVALALYNNSKFDSAKEREVGVVNYILLALAALTLFPALVINWKNNDDLSQSGDYDDRGKQAAYSLGLVYVFISAVAAVVCAKKNKTGLTMFFSFMAYSFFVVNIKSDSALGWANLNVFRVAKQDDVAISYTDFGRIYSTAAHGDDFRDQTLGSGFLAQIGNMMCLLAVVLLRESDKDRPAMPAMIVAGIAILVWIVTLIVAATSDAIQTNSTNVVQTVFSLGIPDTYYGAFSFISDAFVLIVFAAASCAFGGLINYAFFIITAIGSLEWLNDAFDVANDIDTSSTLVGQTEILAVGVISFLVTWLVVFSGNFLFSAQD